MFDKNYKIKSHANEIKEKFDELIILTKLLGYSISSSGKYVNVTSDTKSILKISIKCNSNNIRRMDIKVYDKKLEKKISSTFNKERVMRPSGYDVGFKITDMNEFSPIMAVIMQKF